MGKYRFFIFLLIIYLIGFLILPEICSATDIKKISPEQIEKYLELPRKDTQSLLSTLEQVFHTDWKHREVLGYPAEERLVSLLLREAVEEDALNYGLIDVPFQVGWGIINNSIKVARLIGAKDISVILSELKKESVKKATEYGMNFLLQNKTRVTSGAIEFEYQLQKGGMGKALLQYVLIYQPIDNQRRKVAIKFYSPTHIEPPSPIGVRGAPSLKGKLPPFTVEITGRVEVEKGVRNIYYWIDERGRRFIERPAGFRPTRIEPLISIQPTIKIDFPPRVPDLGIRPLGFWERNFLQPIRTTTRETERAINWVGNVSVGIGRGVVDIGRAVGGGIADTGRAVGGGIADTGRAIGQGAWNWGARILDNVQRINLFGAHVVPPLPDVSAPNVPVQEVEQEPRTELKPQPEKPESETTLPQVSERELGRLQRMLNDLAREINVLNKEVEMVVAQRERIKQEEDKKEDKKEDIKKEDKDVRDIRSAPCLKNSIDINRASKQELEKIIEIGPSRAARIIEMREIKPFSSLDDLLRVSGIATTTLQRIKDQGCVFVRIVGGSGFVAPPPSPPASPSPAPPQNQSPIAKFTFSPQSPVINQEIIFEASSSTDADGHITSFIWDFGDNTTTTTTSTTTTHRYSTSSNFTVTLTVVDNNSATSTTSTTVAIITPYPPTLKVVINEIAWMGTEASPNDEWIELYNNTTSSIDLAGWRILKSGEDFITISTSTVVTTTIPAQGFFLLERTNHDTTSEPADLIYGNDDHKWALHNEGEILKLIDNQWNLVDKVECIKNENRHCVGWFAVDREKRISMERISATTTGTTSTNWASWASNNVIVRNGKDADGGDINGTPKSKNSVSIFPKMIYIFSGIESITLPTKSRIQFSAEIWGVEQRINATPTWSVENTDIGSITSGGVFTASTTGETIITASLGAISDRINIFVKEFPKHTTGTRTPPAKEWSWLLKRDFDNQAHSVQQTDDGGLIILGQTMLPGIGGRASWLIRTDAQGNKKWSRIFHPTDAAGMRVDNWARSVQQTKDGGFIIVGQRMSSVDLGWGLMWLIKTNSDGEKQWDKTFGSGRGSHKKAYSVQQTTDGGFILAGRKWWSGGSFLQLIKTSATGTHEWTYTHSGGSQQGIIGESARSVQQTPNGDFIAAGYTNRYNKELATDFLLLKISATGTYKWSRNFGGTGLDKAYSVQQTRDGGFIIAGVRDFMWGVHDIWLIKTDAQGNKKWNRTFGEGGLDWAHSVQQTKDGGFIIAGYTASFGAGGNDFWLVKTSITGTKEWSRTFGGPGDDRAYSVQQTTDRGFIITGSTASFGEKERNIWLVKVAP